MSVESATSDVMVQVLNEMKTEKTPMPSDVSVELIAASELLIQMTTKLCQSAGCIVNAS